jgi:DNA-binding FadR family transcriptional regulator
MSTKPAPEAPGVFTSIKSVNRSAEVKTQLMRAIEKGDLKPGQQIPAERELCEVFKVSRVSVREALRGLEALGLIEIFQGRGCFVAEGPGGRFPAAFVTWIRVHKDEYVELMKVRGALDALAASEAAVKGSAKKLRRISKLGERFAALAEQDPIPVAELVDCDLELHLAIADASSSKLVRDLLEHLNEQLVESRHVSFAMPGRAADSAREHAAIIEAIVERRPDDARTEATRHMTSGQESLVEAVTKVAVGA